MAQWEEQKTKICMRKIGKCAFTEQKCRIFPCPLPIPRWQRWERGTANVHVNLNRDTALQVAADDEMLSALLADIQNFLFWKSSKTGELKR
jgi:hypothetical protein